VTSKENCGSTFTFVLPYRVLLIREHSDDTDEDSISDNEALADSSPDETNGSFLFKPRTLGTLFSTGGSVNGKTKKFCRNTLEPLKSPNGLSEDSDSFSSNGCILRATASADDFSSVSDVGNTCTDLESPSRNLKLHIRNTEAVNRKECLNHNSCSMDYSRIQRSGSPDYCALRCSGEANTSASSNHNHENGPNSRRTSNGSTGEKKLSLAPKILLVEDNKINIMVAQSMMKQFGHSIDIANNGLEAIRAVQRTQYDLVLMVIYQTWFLVYFGVREFKFFVHD